IYFSFDVHILARSDPFTENDKFGADVVELDNAAGRGASINRWRLGQLASRFERLERSDHKASGGSVGSPIDRRRWKIRRSQFEYPTHLLRKIVLGHRGVDFNGGQSQMLRFLANDVREHPIAFEQVAQGSFRVTGPREKAPHCSASPLDDCLAELVGREE